MKPKTKQSKEEIHKQINRRANKAQVDAIVCRTLELVRQNMQYRDVKDVLIREHGKSERQTEKYIQKAFAIIREDFEENIQIKKTEFYESLHGDLLEAEKNYKAIDNPTHRMKVVWFKMMLEVKDRIAKFYPDTPQEDPNQQIVKVQYQVLPPKDDNE